MFRLPSHIRLLACVACMFSAIPSLAQEKDKVKPAGGDKPQVHRLEIYNGGARTVHYFTDGGSMSDRITLGDLQRLEGEMATTENLAHLRAQYVRDERELQRRRSVVQNLLYGNATTYGTGFYPGVAYGGFSTPFPLGYSYRGLTTSAFYPGVIGSTGTTTQSLAVGIGDEGVLKTELARSLAQMATPQYAAQTRQEYYSTLDRIGNDARLAGLVGVKKGEVVGVEYARPAPTGMGLSAGDQVVLTAKAGGKIEGRFVRETGDWVTVNTGAEVMTIRKEEIVSFSKKQGN